MLIREATIRGFRSLRNVKIAGLTTSSVFHGENNTGKSNIVHALEAIFARKFSLTDVELPASLASETPPPARITEFWDGRLPNASNDFYLGGLQPIEFNVVLEMDPDEITSVRESSLLEIDPSPGHNFRIVLTGALQRINQDSEMQLQLVTINKKAIFDRTAGEVQYLGSSSAPVERRQAFVEGFLTRLTDSVYVIPSQRYLASESADDAESLAPSPNSAHFKNWLHAQYLSREGFAVFEKIRRWFSEPPFNYGQLSFMRDARSIEIMVDDGSGYRMPIESKGTGVQQVLVLLGFIAVRQPDVVAVEEPELNLSFANQDAVVSKLISLVHASNEQPHQLLVTSHSDHVGSRSDMKQYHVSFSPGTGTVVRSFTDKDRARLFPRSPGKRIIG